MTHPQIQPIVKPIHNGIIFQFEESVTKGTFRESSETGIYLGGSFNESAKEKPRWGIVQFCGPKCKHVLPGMRVLIKSFQWTTEFKIEGFNGQFWKTDEDQILAIDLDHE